MPDSMTPNLELSGPNRHKGTTMNTEMQPAGAGPLERRVRRLPPKVMGEFPDMTPIEKLEADFRRLARVARTYANERFTREGQSHMWSHYSAQDTAYIVAAEKVRRMRGLLTPNAAITGKPGAHSA
jgi:hypothetical protein